ncbi:hypothetical protein PHLCEN_2v6105 [Hermanssonia centrifuga]|uniref:Uncharacterized protein n=1 Tax=Hermanssonia centrifuga TaxID=98765 RepID=A0A2R6P0F0_9APHY|nr:hypothetical protein PHLCEN_2v6105 [Hermanssonia centrifuga]
MNIPATSDDDVSELGDDDDSDIEQQDEPDQVTEVALLEKLLKQDASAGLQSTATDDCMFSLSCAAVALSLDEMNQVQSYNAPSEQDSLAEQRIDADTLQVILQVSATFDLPPLETLAAERIRPFDRAMNYSKNMDYSMLVSVCRHHQTERAAAAVCVRLHSDVVPLDPSKSDSDLEVTETPSARGKIISEMYAVLRKAEQGLGVGTGLERQARISGSTVVQLTGNTANAALAAGQRATTVVNRRYKVFSKHHIPQSKELGDALIGISHSSQPNHQLLKPGRNGAKNGTHAWVADTKNIGLVSYLVMQVYEPAFLTKFRAVHQRVAALQTYSFLHVSSDHFLRTLPGTQTLSTDGRTMELNQDAYAVFQGLDTTRAKSAINAAVKLLDQARRKGNKGTTNKE